MDTLSPVIVEATAVRTSPPAIAALTAGVAIGPGIAVGLSGGLGPPGLLLAALVTVLLAAVGVYGIARTLRRWAVARRSPAVLVPPATRFEAPGQRGSLVAAVLLLVVLVIGGLLAGAAAVVGPSTGPGAGVLQLIVLAAIGVVAGACAVPVVLFQSRWTWHVGIAETEAAVIAGLASGDARRIRSARALAMTAWSVGTAAGIVVAAIAVVTTVPRLAATVESYEAEQVGQQVAITLDVDGYLVTDVRCPLTGSPLLGPSTIRCTLTSLGQPRSLQVRWTPGIDGGSVVVVRAAASGLSTAADLPDRAPVLAPTNRDWTSTEIEAVIRAQLRREGWGATSVPVSQLACPGVSAANQGVFRCRVGDRAAARMLDVYSTAHDTLTARTSELVGLRH